MQFSRLVELEILLAQHLHVSAQREDVERVAREEDEIECAIIAYEAAGKPGEAARIYEEIAGEDVSSPAAVVLESSEPAVETSEGLTRRCSCGESLQPHWKLCPACGKQVELICSCGEALKASWRLCPTCGKKVDGG